VKGFTVKRWFGRLAGVAFVAAMASQAPAQLPIAPARVTEPEIVEGERVIRGELGTPKETALPAFEKQPEKKPKEPPKKEPEPTSEPSLPAPTGSGEFRRARLTNYFQSGLTPSGSGTGGGGTAGGVPVTSMMLGITSVVTTINTQYSNLPLILPGMLASANSEWARPADRVFFTYAYLDRFQVIAGPGPTINPTTALVTIGPLSRQAGFNLNRLDVGIEKTILDGRASVYVRVPFLEATDNTSTQSIDGISNVTTGFKYMLLFDQETGSALTGGLDVSAPTGRSTTIITSTSINATVTTDLKGKVVPPLPSIATTFTTSKINPTYLQPYVAGIIARDRFFVHEFFGVLVSTDERIPTLLNNDVTMGYQIYRAAPGRFLSSVTPFLDVQALLTTGRQGTSGQPAVSFSALPFAVNPPQAQSTSNRLDFTHQLFISPGLSLGLGERAVLSVGSTTPVVGPRAFNWGATVGLNFFY
jgi:hypothetical protein